jgi:PAS domain S-box-containing protein
MPARTFLNHPGKMAARIREADWSQHPLGAPDGWPDALRVAIDICLGSSFPTAIYWGRDLHLLYNDAWAFMPGDRHPWALGRPAAEVWPADVWAVIGPQLAGALDGQAFSLFDQMLPMVRDGVRQETYWTYSFSPIRGGEGTVDGVFHQGNETSHTVLAERERKVETERLREIFHQAPGAVALLAGPDFVFEMTNDAYAELTGRRDVIGKTVAEALPEIAEQGFIELLRIAFETGETYRAHKTPVVLGRGPGGAMETRLLDFVYQPIRNQDGAVADIFVIATDVTERIRAQDAVRASEERLQLALDASAGIGTWDWDLVANVARADARFARLYDISPASVETGIPYDEFFERIHPDDHAHVVAGIERSLESGAPYAEEYRLIHADGTEVWVAAQGRVVYDDAGTAIRFPGVSVDVTKRRRAEQAARDAADDLRLATEAQAFVFRLAERLRGLDSPNAIMRLSATALGRRLAVDRVGFYRTLSDSLIQFVACWTSERLPPLSGTLTLAELGPATLAAYRAGETRVIHDYAHDESARDAGIARLMGAAVSVPLRRQGQWAATLFVNHATARHWTAEEVALIDAVAEIAWDAVDRANAVSALRESEEKFRAIANSIDQMVWAALPDGYHDYYNERWYEFTGVARGATDGDAWTTMFHPDDRDRFDEQWQHSLLTGEACRLEYRLWHHSGEYRWVLGSAQAVRDEHGRITRWFGTCTDIAEIVAAREVLARSRADLEKAVAERTAQLMAAEEQLRQAQKMEAVGQLTGGIAHDFNNMLAVVVGALDLLERRIAQGQTDVARYIDAARDGATRAAALTQRLLAFSRQSPLAPASIDLNAMVRGMADMLNRTLGEAITVQIELAPGLWNATADISQLENSVLNLSVNARDAMPRGGRLTITTRNRVVATDQAVALGMVEGDYVEIAVGDTGSGMSEAVAAKAFDPFFTTKSVGKGTGLGLSQVFGFVHQSGGHVALDTVTDKGTTVSILLPRDLDDAAPVPDPAARVDLSAAPRGSEVVLVVEDDDRVRAYSVEALRELGYTVIHASSGAAALRLLDHGQHADLLFTDVVMPEMTGDELAEAARRRLPELRVLFTSGYTRDTFEPVAGALLNKPFDVIALASRIRAALDV